MTQGDHLRALRGGAWDHAIDLGDRTIIRFVPGRGLERTEYAGFVDGAERIEVVVHRERVYRPPLVVARAFSRFAESAYGAMFQSGEQFAVWCKSGQLPARPGDGGAAATRAARRAPGATGRAKARRSTPARKAAPARKASPARKARRPARPAARAKAKGKSKAAKVRRAPAARKGRRPARPARKAPRARRG